MDDYDGGVSDGSWWEAAPAISADNSFDYARTPITVPSNALQSMQPVAPSSSGAWTSLFQDGLKLGINYAIAKDAAKNGIPAPGQAAATPTAQVYAQQQQTSLVTLLILAGLGFVLLKAVT